MSSILKERSFPLRKLPLEVIVLVLSNLENPRDLRAAIRACSLCFKLFCRYRGLLLTRVAKYLFGASRWEAAKTVLTYQRYVYKQSFDQEALQADLGSVFVPRVSDFTQMRSNERVFREFGEEMNNILERERAKPAPKDNVIIPRSATTSQAFYRAWTISMRFHFESVQKFFELEPHSNGHCHVLQKLCRLMYSDYTPHMTPVGNRRLGVASATAMSLTEIWGSDIYCFSEYRPVPPNFHSFVFKYTDSVLLSKMKWMLHQRSSDTDYATSVASLEAECKKPEVNIEELVERYKLAGDWSFWPKKLPVNYRRPGRYTVCCFGLAYKFLGEE